MRPRSSLWLSLFALGCASPTARDVHEPAPPRSDSGLVDVPSEDPPLPPGDDADRWRPDTPLNLLFVLLDDVGVEMIGAYGVPDAETPPTPHIDALAAEGVRFAHAWANPWCSPTRATILTGKHVRRLGIGRAIELFGETTSLSTDELTVIERLADAAPWDYRRALFGKWHVTAASEGADAPREHGFEHFSGTLGNLTAKHAIDGERQDFFDWEQIVDGEVTRTRGYATTRTIDDALGWITAQDGPWVAWVGLHAGHTPRHVPPAELHTYGARVYDGPVWRYRAMVEAADHEIGRLIDGIDPEVRARTMIVVAGDNGATKNDGLGAFEGRSGKSTVFERGLRVPLIVAGPAVIRPAVVDAIVQLTDLHDTLAELGGVELTATDTPDSVSLVPYLRDPDLAPLRSWIYAEAFTPNVGDPDRRASDQRAASDGTFKLMDRNGETALYRLGSALLEDAPLDADALDADARAARDRLAEVLAAAGG